MIFDGDSLTEGFGLTIPPDVTYPNQVKALLSYATDQTWNVAVGGQTAAQRTAAISTSVVPKFNRTGAPQIVIIWVGTNSIYFGASAATTYADIKAYCNAIHAANASAKIIVVDILPRSGSGVPGTFETDRSSVNASLAADFASSTAYTNVYTGASYADCLVRLSLDATIGAAGAELNTTYYLDKTHLTSTGYSIVAPYVRDAIYVINPPSF